MYFKFRLIFLPEQNFYLKRTMINLRRTCLNNKLCIVQFFKN
ncbi:unnamed protein product [Schistosoma curassoni]|uniref:Uncharacterized protein n=1 Tax=Schistosoma curassoni TaxID=6186 RepID=A0A183L433_9TREM|nr:unnamed protein product [Schistosoma curassoni]